MKQRELRQGATLLEEGVGTKKSKDRSRSCLKFRIEQATCRVIRRAINPRDEAPESVEALYAATIILGQGANRTSNPAQVLLLD